MSRRIEDLTLELQERCKEFLVACSKAGHPMIVVQTFRSMEEQEALYAKGRVWPGMRVTNARAGDSLHNYRMAFDVCFHVGSGELSWDGPWELVGSIGQNLGLTWDPIIKSHFEFSNGYDLAALKARYMIQEITHV